MSLEQPAMDHLIYYRCVLPRHQKGSVPLFTLRERKWAYCPTNEPDGSDGLHQWIELVSPVVAASLWRHADPLRPKV